MYKQTNFFMEGFEQDQLEKNPNFSSQSSLDIVFDQISFDIELMEKIAKQRSGLYKNFLNRVDCLVWEALEPAITHNLLPYKPAVLTYFQKATSIRVIPYAPIILVGIPYAGMINQRDLLAIPHEVGHYVYRMGRYNNSSLSRWAANTMANSTANGGPALEEWAKEWFEEIFSDVYGTLTAGLVMALDFQDLQERETLKHFYEADGEHPVAVLRPYIYLNTLLHIDPANEPQWITKLQDNWHIHLAERKINLNEINENWAAELKVEANRFLSGNESFSVEEAISTEKDGIAAGSQKPVDYLIKAILKDLLPAETYGNWSPNFNAQSEDIEVLYSAFIQWFEKFDIACMNTLPTLKLRDDNTILFNDAPVGYALGDTGLPMDAIRNRRENLAANEEITDEGEGWFLVLDAGGWAVKGPVCEGAGTCP